jgi:hypothetical protein
MAGGEFALSAVTIILASMAVSPATCPCIACIIAIDASLGMNERIVSFMHGRYVCMHAHFLSMPVLTLTAEQFLVGTVLNMHFMPSFE